MTETTKAKPTEAELNRAIHKKRFGLPPYPSYEEVPDLETYDPCNNLEQAWEAMLHFDVSVTKWGEGFVAVSNLGSHRSDWDTDCLYCNEVAFDAKPLVAAMRVLMEV